MSTLLNAETDTERTSLRTYLSVLRRRRGTFLTIAVLAPVIAAVLSLLQTPNYQGTAEVYLSRQNLANAINGLPDPGSSAADTNNRVGQTQADLARVPIIAVRTLRAVHVRETPQDFLDRSSVESRANTDLLTFHVTDESPALAARLTTEYGRQFTIYRRELDTAAITRAQSSVEDRLHSLEASGRGDDSLSRKLEDKSQELSTLAALQTSNASLVRPSAAGIKVKPRTLRNVVIAVVLGILLGLGAVFAREALDTRLRDPETIGEMLRVPMLGLLPRPPRKLRLKSQPAMLTEPQGLSAEAFRMLRINIDFRTIGTNLSRLLIVSAVPAEGKSTTCANLAVAFARSGRRVVVVDLDLRRPQLHRFFGLSERPGVTDVALGSLTLDDALHDIPLFDDAVVDDGTPNEASLTVLTAGQLPPAPGEFVGTEALSSILRELEHRADLVLIDSPPLLRVGDAMQLMLEASGVLLVAHMELLRRPMLRELLRLFETSSANLLGYVATGIGDEQSYGYGYGSYPPATDRERLHA